MGGKRVRKRIAFASGLVLLVALVVACVLAAPVAAAPKTTAPNTGYRIGVVMTDASITIARDQFTTARGTARYPRGAIIDFVVRNRGTQAHSARLKLLSQHYFSKVEQPIVEIPVGKAPIEPGHVVHLAINFYYRGLFALQLMASGKPLASAQIIIF